MVFGRRAAAEVLTESRLPGWTSHAPMRPTGSGVPTPVPPTEPVAPERTPGRSPDSTLLRGILIVWVLFGLAGGSASSSGG